MSHTCECDPRSCSKCGGILENPGGHHPCYSCAADDNRRRRQAEWDDATRKHDARTGAGVAVCSARTKELRWCRNPPIYGARLCVSHADDDIVFAARYGKMLGEMAIIEVDPAHRTGHSSITILNQRVEIHRQTVALQAEANRQREALLLGPWAGFGPGQRVSWANPADRPSGSEHAERMREWMSERGW